MHPHVESKFIAKSLHTKKKQKQFLDELSADTSKGILFIFTLILVIHFFISDTAELNSF